MQLTFSSSLMLAICLAACEPTETPSAEPKAVDVPVTAAESDRFNPFFHAWGTPRGIPPFTDIREEHYLPAIEAGIADQREDLERIRDNPAPPDFANTILVLENSGEFLTRVRSLLNNAINTGSTEYLLQLEEQIRPRLSAESQELLLDEEMFKRIEAVYLQRDALGLDPDEMRLLTNLYQRFSHAGNALEKAAKARLKTLDARLARLKTRFAANVLSATREFELLIKDEVNLAGLSEGSIRRARQAAAAKGHPDGWLFGLSRSVFENFMTYSQVPDLRRQMLNGYRSRGTGHGNYDNREIVLEISAVRAEIAELLGYSSHAEKQLKNRMAKSPEEVARFLQEIWQPALAKASQELQTLQELKRADGIDSPLEASDWWYYARMLRRNRFQVTEREIRPYFELQNVRNGAFYVAGRLFGLRFERLESAPVWHGDVQVWEVFGPADEFLGVYMTDDYARPGKRGGSWKGLLRAASSSGGASIRPIVTNNTNLPRPVPGKPTMLNLREVGTLFHEFGHALQGLMTTVPFASISGSADLPRDYREFPSQFMERYATRPEVLRAYSRHAETGQPIPEALIVKIQAISDHNQGFRSVESIAASILDLSWHDMPLHQVRAITDTLEHENQVLARLDPLPQIGPRYRSAYFSHIFSGAYSAGYYSYLWSEILDADGFSAFLEAGDIFDPELAKRLKRYIFEAGSREDADVLYRKFRGREPGIEAFLRFRGLDAER